MSIAPFAGPSFADFNAGLCPEIELLLCCARRPPSAPERIRHLIGSELNWDYLIALALRHGLMPLLYRHFNDLAVTTIPRKVFAQLWSRYESNARRNAGMARELLNILRIFDANDIPGIPYKGPALAAFVYGDLASREFGDLDILLRREDVLRAKRLLQAHGFAPDSDLGPVAEAAFLRSGKQYHLTLVHEAREVMVELHWKTDACFPVEDAADSQWWAALEFVSFGEESIRCFTTEALLLILCLHGTKHRWESLGWLVDVAELVRQHPKLDWEWILGKSEELKCLRSLALPLYLMMHLLDTPLPEQIQNKIKGMAAIKQAADKILETLFDATPSEPGPIEALRFDLALLEYPGQKVAQLMNVVLEPTPIEWMLWPLPRGLFFLYLPLRVFRLIKKHSQKLFLGTFLQR